MNDTEQQISRVSDLRTHMVALARRLRQSARADSETWTALMVLGAIERADGRATPAQIALELEIRSSNLAQVLGELDKRGLIRRTPDPVDKRKVRLSLTTDGLALVRRTRAERDAWLSEAMKVCLSAEEQSQLLAAGELIRRLALAPQGSPKGSE